MNRAIVLFFAGVLMGAVPSRASAQTGTKSAQSPAVEARLDALAKKMDEQNLKIDLLSQQILKLQQQLIGNTSGSSTPAGGRPGVMIGEGAPSVATSTSASSTTSSPVPPAAGPGGTSHIVARGETLTSIAKANNVSVSDLQKFNHIENPLKLQAGQTIMIPPSPAPGSTSGD